MPHAQQPTNSGSAGSSDPAGRSLTLSAQFFDAFLSGDGLAGPFAGASIGAGALTADGQAAAMAKPAITADVAQTDDVLLHLAAERAFHGVLAVEDAGQPADLVFVEVLGAALRIDLGLAAQLQRGRRPNPVDVTQRNMRRL